MTSYAKNTLMGPIVGSLTDSTKGSMGNRVDCAGANIKNNATAYLQAAGVAGTVVGAAAFAYQKPKAYSKVAASFAKITGQGLQQLAKMMPKNAAKNIEHLSGKVKGNPRNALGAAVLTAAAFALGCIGRNHAYKAGQIDQKYTDRATIQQQTV